MCQQHLPGRRNYRTSYSFTAGCGLRVVAIDSGLQGRNCHIVGNNGRQKSNMSNICRDKFDGK